MNNSNKESKYSNIEEEDYLLDKVDDKLLLELIENEGNIESKLDLETANNQLIKDLTEKFKLQEAKMLAFLNIEFNILNKKMITCNKNCYNPSRTMKQVNVCLSNCRYGISKAYKFTADLQNSLVSSNDTCLQKIKNTNSGKGIGEEFVACYEQLIVKFKDSEKLLKSEYSNYI